MSAQEATAPSCTSRDGPIALMIRAKPKDLGEFVVRRTLPAPEKKACEALGLSLRTVQRWERGGATDQRRGSRAKPANALSETEKEEIMSIMNQPVYRDKTPHQIVPQLADEGRYLASESTMYRLLRESQQLAHRQRSAPAHRYEKLPRVAAACGSFIFFDHMGPADFDPGSGVSVRAHPHCFDRHRNHYLSFCRPDHAPTFRPTNRVATVH